jgi:putative membrane protein
MPSFMAFLHHLAAFALVAALVVEMVLMRGELSPTAVRKLARWDMIYGISAGALLAIGLLRVFYFEKGAGYYFHNAPFLAKLGLFLGVGLLSIYPTLKLAAWKKQAPDPASVAAVRRVLHIELAGIVVILLCAALMADGIGFLG